MRGVKNWLNLPTESADVKEGGVKNPEKNAEVVYGPSPRSTYLTTMPVVSLGKF